MPEDNLDARVEQKLMAASEWLVVNGIATFNASGQDGLFRRLLDGWGVQLWVEPNIDDDRFLARFKIKGRGIYHDIHKLYRAEAGTTAVEYWIVKISSREWSSIPPQTQFLLVEAPDPDGTRRIIHRSERFFYHFDVPGAFSFSLPLNDRRMIYDMEPWRFVRNYAGTPLADRRIDVDKNGNFIEAKP